MSKMNQNRLGFFVLGAVFGGWVLKFVRSAAMVGGAR